MAQFVATSSLYKTVFSQMSRTTFLRKDKLLTWRDALEEIITRSLRTSGIPDKLARPFKRIRQSRRSRESAVCGNLFTWEAGKHRQFAPLPDNSGRKEVLYYLRFANWETRLPPVIVVFFFFVFSSRYSKINIAHRRIVVTHLWLF